MSEWLRDMFNEKKKPSLLKKKGKDCNPCDEVDEVIDLIRDKVDDNTMFAVEGYLGHIKKMFNKAKEIVEKDGEE